MKARRGRTTRVRRRVVSDTGWGLTALALVSWSLGDRYRWPELTLLATVAAGILMAGLVLVALPRRIDAQLRLLPARVTAGEPARALVHVGGRAVRVLPPVVEVPLREEGTLGASAPGVRGARAETGQVRLEMELPTTRRGIVDVGPARHVRSDPLGLFQRRVEVTGTAQLHVRPVVVALPSLASGIVHDLEGAASDKLAESDLSFHALREYEPGDDPRHIHWKSTARAGSLLVRQFQLTRRTHVTVLLDPAPGSYSSTDEFEVAVSVATSLALRALADDYEVTFGCGDDVVTTREPQRLLDFACRVGLSRRSFKDTALKAATASAGTSLVAVVSGGRCDAGESRHAIAHFASDAESFLAKVDSDSEPRATRSDTHTTLELAALAQLPALLVRATW
jgi:uncharacterized protein (DUF58 family)